MTGYRTAKGLTICTPALRTSEPLRVATVNEVALLRAGEQPVDRAIVGPSRPPVQAQSDCATFLRGVEKPVGKGYRMPAMSESESARVRATRSRIDDLHSTLLATPEKHLMEQMETEIHGLVAAVRDLPGHRLGEVGRQQHAAIVQDGS